MDLSEFRTIRSPRLVEPSALLAGDLDEQLPALLQKPDLNGLAQLAMDFRAGRQDPRQVSRVNPDTPAQTVFAVIGEVSDWLEEHHDRAAGKDWAEVVSRRVQPYVSRVGEPAWLEALDQSARELSDWTYVALIERDLGMAADLTRWWTVRRMLALPDSKGFSVADTARYLSVQLPQLSASVKQLVPQARVELVRDASVADLYVVRSEWRSYLLGDIAAVTNVLPGEMHQHLTRHTSEEETTASTETSTQTKTETSTEQEVQSEMSSETNTQLHAEINGFLKADVQQSWGSGSVKVSGGVEGRLSLDQSQRQASRIARRSVDRAVSTVDNMTRESRVRRSLSRFEDTVDNKMDNTGGKLIRGVYRWLDRIDRYQLFRYPDRLQLEFQLPEPAEYPRWLARERSKHDDTEAPPKWDLSNDDIVNDEFVLLDLAAKYHATNLPVLPAAQISVVQAVRAEAKGEHGTPAKVEDALQLPLALEELELLVPPGYQATQLTFSGFAAPAWGTWLGENADGKSWDRHPGWHGAVFTVLVGDRYYWASNQVSGSPAHSTDAVPRTLGLDGTTPWPRFGNAFVELNGGNDTKPRSVDFSPPAVGKVKVAVQGAGVSAAQVAVTMKCVRTEEASNAWRQGVYDTLYEAWSSWKRSWDADRTRAAELDLLSSGGSASRVEQIIREEIKRQVISWLLGPARFEGFPALLLGDGTTFRDTDFDQARATAPVIEFLEQAFEWGNLTYMLYPYFWAGRASWDNLQQLRHPNPDMERFLRSGSARVVVPARPVMAGAVRNWLIYQEPFFGRPLPVPGDPLFVSVAQEIHDLTQPPADGEPSDSWEARSGTTLLWLDETGQLPRNTAGTLGQPPHEPIPLLSAPTP